MLSRLFLFLAICAACCPLVVRSEISTEEQRKRDLFLRARESIVPSPPSTPAPTPVRPAPRPRPTAARRAATPPPKPSPTPHRTEEEKSVPKPTSTPRPAPAKHAEESVRKLPPSPERTPTPTPHATPREAPAAPITIEKSGVHEDQGLLPTPKPAGRGFLGLGGPRYRYLTRGVRSAIDRAPVKRSLWQYIIVHNSGTRQGNAKIFNNYHRNVRRMQNGLAYHFVIGNGTSSGDGEIEIGPRWTRQINGGHVASDYLNSISLGICLVGDYNRTAPTEAQLGALDELIRYLRIRVGKTKGRVSIVKAHREINPKPTDCPGSRFPYRWLHRKFD